MRARETEGMMEVLRVNDADQNRALGLRTRLRPKRNLRLTAIVVAAILGLAFYAKWGRLGIAAGALLLIIALVAPSRSPLRK